MRTFDIQMVKYLSEKKKRLQVSFLFKNLSFYDDDEVTYINLAFYL